MSDSCPGNSHLSGRPGDSCAVILVSTVVLTVSELCFAENRNQYGAFHQRGENRSPTLPLRTLRRNI